MTHPHPTRGLRERRPKTAEARASTSRRAAPASPPHHASPSPLNHRYDDSPQSQPKQAASKLVFGRVPQIVQTQRASNFAATALADVLNTVGSMQRCAGLARRGSDAPGDLCHRFHLPRALARPRLVLGPRRAAKPLRATGQPRWGNLGYTLLLHTKILPSRDSSRWPWTSGPGRGAARGRAPSTLSPRRRLRVSGAAMASRRAPLARDMMDLVLIYTHTTQARGARAAAGPGP